MYFSNFIDIKYYFSIILEADSGSVVQKVALRTDDIPLGEQTVTQVIILICLEFIICGKNIKTASTKH